MSLQFITTAHYARLIGRAATARIGQHAADEREAGAVLKQKPGGSMFVEQGCKLVDEGCKLSVWAVIMHADRVALAKYSPLTPLNCWAIGVNCWQHNGGAMADHELLQQAAKYGISFGIGAGTGRPRIAWHIGTELHSRDMPPADSISLPIRDDNWFRHAIADAASEISAASDTGNTTEGL